MKDYKLEGQLLKKKHKSQLRYLRDEIEAYRDKCVVLNQKIRFINRKNNIDQYDIFYLESKDRIYRLLKFLNRKYVVWHKNIKTWGKN